MDSLNSWSYEKRGKNLILKGKIKTLKISYVKKY